MAIRITLFSDLDKKKREWILKSSEWAGYRRIIQNLNGDKLV